MDEFERLIDELERKVGEEERAHFAPTVIEHAHRPRNLGRMDQAQASAVVRGWCGDTMEIYLRFGPDQRIEAASFMTDGCGPTVACGSVLTGLVTGRSIAEALRVSAAEVVNALGGLPEESIHCAELAVNTLREAIAGRG